MQSYWNGNGILQEAADRMHEELVPREGKAETVLGEGLRSICNLYYDLYNNGGCNIFDCWDTPLQHATRLSEIGREYVEGVVGTGLVDEEELTQILIDVKNHGLDSCEVEGPACRELEDVYTNVVAYCLLAVSEDRA
mgnify:CR=1 FL=1|tara:strand:+ start:542 stop:952 length:411 start_codon:yes stop_codon:yes gene_type:complete